MKRIGADESAAGESVADEIAPCVMAHVEIDDRGLHAATEREL
jgi:hypothetical protein